MRPIEEDPLGRKLDALMPWPFNLRITAEHAAQVIADGINRRAPSTYATAGWRPYALLRGVLNPVIDNRAAASRTVHGLIHTIEQRTIEQRSGVAR
jgi:hypothetical protein